MSLFVVAAVVFVVAAAVSAVSFLLVTLKRVFGGGCCYCPCRRCCWYGV